MRLVGSDLRRVFAEAVMLDDGKVARLGPKGRAWLLVQALPPDEQDGMGRHLREHDRLREDLRLVEREIARDAPADADAKRLMPSPASPWWLPRARWRRSARSNASPLPTSWSPSSA
jgi:hypothetical protein